MFTKQQLVNMVGALGIDHTVKREYSKTGKETTPKRNYLRAVQIHQLKLKYGDPLPWEREAGIKFRPQLASRRPPSGIDNIFDESGWLFEEKINGIRGIVCINEHYDVIMYSRFLEDSGVLPLELTNITIHHNMVVPNFPKCTVIDVMCQPTEEMMEASEGDYTEPREILWSMVRSGQYDLLEIANIYPIDLLCCSGVSLLEEPQHTRDLFRLSVFSFLKRIPLFTVKYPRHTTSRGIELYEAVLREGGEGIVAKNMQSIYAPSSRTVSWVKVKPESALWDYGDTVDLFVSRAKDGIVKLSGLISDEFGILSTVEVASLEIDSPEELLGMVAEIRCDGIDKTTKRLLNPSLVSWRSDKTPEDCIIEGGEFDEYFSI